MAEARTIAISDVRYAIVRVGVLPDHPDVRDAFEHELSPTGLEMIKRGPLKGKSLFEIQAVVSSEKLLVGKDPI